MTSSVAIVTSPTSSDSFQRVRDLLFCWLLYNIWLTARSLDAISKRTCDVITFKSFPTPSGRIESRLWRRRRPFRHFLYTAMVCEEIALKVEHDCEIVTSSLRQYDRSGRVPSPQISANQIAHISNLLKSTSASSAVLLFALPDRAITAPMTLSHY